MLFLIKPLQENASLKKSSAAKMTKEKSVSGKHTCAKSSPNKSSTKIGSKRTMKENVNVASPQEKMALNSPKNAATIPGATRISRMAVESTKTKNTVPATQISPGTSRAKWITDQANGM